MPAADLPGVVRLRDQREALTRRAILTAARRLFAELGYARTPIRRIAHDAGVAPQTIYAHYGSKAGVLTGLVDLLDEEAGLEDVVAQAHGTSDPDALVGLLARAGRQARERCGDILALLGSGAAVGPDVEAARAEGARRNRLGVELIVQRLPGDRARPRAADIAVALLSAEVYDSLVRDAGWSPDAYEAWLADTLTAALLG
ncbi:TetR/AcrR family transcriptional regulator [Streptomyces boncukensis]|uniref:TetR/AcrR family transcriptional regulator n=1 Tax=Streptomyces boncukensis TaxID=2711219 RepID=A0A6G4X3E1_9ACTN|nr:TetR/AcrR family transcriptional regulator [Streptomyces boncukensis]NGO72025.1 TetR/AcrR family transcriptional regulator [Streptomyces boncukensis]